MKVSTTVDGVARIVLASAGPPKPRGGGPACAREEQHRPSQKKRMPAKAPTASTRAIRSSFVLHLHLELDLALFVDRRRIVLQSGRNLISKRVDPAGVCATDMSEDNPAAMVHG